MKRYRNAFTTYDDVVRQFYVDAAGVNQAATAQAIEALQQANTRTFLKNLIFDVSSAIANFTYRTFVPYLETVNVFRDYLAQYLHFNSEAQAYQLTMQDDLLSITSLTWNETLLTAGTQYRLMHPYDSPNRFILLDGTALNTLTDFDDTVDIVGEWGYHNTVSDMWQQIGTLAAELTAGVTSFVATAGTVASFEIYGYLQIENEILFITNVDIADPWTITVERGANGSTDATHANTTPIKRFVQQGAVAMETRRLTIRAYQLRDVSDRMYVASEAIKELVETEFSLPIPPRAIFFGV